MCVSTVASPPLLPPSVSQDLLLSVLFNWLFFRNSLAQVITEKKYSPCHDRSNYYSTQCHEDFRYVENVENDVVNDQSRLQLGTAKYMLLMSDSNNVAVNY